MKFKTYYKIKIISAVNRNIWYYTRKGQEFYAELEKKNGKMMYKIGILFWVYPADCEVVGTRKEKIYER